MLRRANEHETTAFLLVERTLRRTRPQVGARGLESILVPEGTIECGSLGRLRFRFDGRSSDVEPENELATRPLSEEEATLWMHLRRLVDVAGPVADPQWNLVSMRIGERVLRRLPRGTLVTHAPDGAPPFKGSLEGVKPGTRPWSDLALPSVSPGEAALLAAIDAFLREDDRLSRGRLRTKGASSWATPAERAGYLGLSAPLRRSPHLPRSKWQRCPICRTPVVKSRFNPRIPQAALDPGTGAIRDLRGGFLSRLRETYLMAEPESVLKSTDLDDPLGIGLPTEPAPGRP